MMKHQSNENGYTDYGFIVFFIALSALIIGLFVGLFFLLLGAASSGKDESFEAFNTEILQQVEENPTFTNFNNTPGISASDALIKSNFLSVSDDQKWEISKKDSKVTYKTSYNEITLNGNWKKFSIKYSSFTFGDTKTIINNYVLNDEGIYDKKVITK